MTPDVLADRTAVAVARACLDAGLIVNGVTSTTLRLAPPLTVSSGELAEGIGILDDVLTAGAAGEAA